VTTLAPMVIVVVPSAVSSAYIHRGSGGSSGMGVGTGWELGRGIGGSFSEVAGDGAADGVRGGRLQVSVRGRCCGGGVVVGLQRPDRAVGGLVGDPVEAVGGGGHAGPDPVRAGGDGVGVGRARWRVR
jgi:hypothetical protein